MATVGLALAPCLGCGSSVPLPCEISEARRKRRPYTVGAQIACLRAPARLGVGSPKLV